MTLFSFSFLKTLLAPFNEETNKFIEQLKPLADGATEVPMKLHFGDFVLNVISKVIKINHAMHGVCKNDKDQLLGAFHV